MVFFNEKCSEGTKDFAKHHRVAKVTFVREKQNQPGSAGKTPAWTWLQPSAPLADVPTRWGPQSLLTAPQAAGTHMQRAGFAKIRRNHLEKTHSGAEPGLWEALGESDLTALPAPAALWCLFFLK